MRILLAVPHGAKPIDDECLEALWRLDRCGHEIVFRVVGGYDCARARNKIAQEALDLLCDYALMVDADVVVPPDALSTLLEGGGDVVLGCYRRKDAEGRAEVFAPASPRYSGQVQWDELPERRFRVYGGGFGCALVSAAALRRITRPWFDYVEHADGSILSEDLYFCEKAESMGLKVHADGRVRCKHVGRRVYE